MMNYLNRLRNNTRALQPGSAPGNLTSHTVHGTLHEAEVFPTQPLPDYPTTNTTCPYG